jgi:hypothetical protein
LKGSIPAGQSHRRTSGGAAVKRQPFVKPNHFEDKSMRDLAIRLKNRPGALAEMGEALGNAGVSVEGGGAFLFNGEAIAHFLFDDAAAARKALEEKGITVLEDRKVLVQRLRQGQPGQLGKIARLMADAGVNIEVIYSDHQNQLILVVDDYEKGRAVSEMWTKNELK